MKYVRSLLKEIEWDKIYLNLKIEIEKISLHQKSRFILINLDKIAVTEFDVIDRKENFYHIRLNITNSGINRCVDNGTYTLLITDNENFYSELEFHGEIKYLLQHNTCLRHANDSRAYTVTFIIPEEADKPVLQFLFYNMRKTGMANMDPLFANINNINKNVNYKKYIINKIFNRIINRQIKHKIAKKVFSFWQYFLYNSNNKNILFISYMDNKLAINMQCLYNRLLERNFDKEYNISFSLRDIAKGEGNIFNSIKLLYFIARANVIIVDDYINMLDWLILNKSQKLIQLWHSGAGFKCIGYIRWGHKFAPGTFCCHRQYTYHVAGSQHIANDFAEVAGILPEQVIPTGMPRFDKFLNLKHQEKIVNTIFNMYPNFKNKKIILFAPTYRGRNKQEAFYPYQKIDFELLFEYCKADNAIVLFKMHPFVKTAVPIQEKHKEVFFDFTNYPDINDLFYITNILITDYSSSMYEYALMKRPMLAYSFDIVQYSSYRGFPRPYDENIPGKICKTFKELIYSLKEKDYQFEKNKVYIKKNFDHVDTQNSDRVIDWLILDKLPEEYKKKLDEKVKKINELRGKSFAYLFDK